MENKDDYMESGLYIDGEWTETDEFIEVKNPYNGGMVGRVAKAAKEDVSRAVQSSAKTFKIYRSTPLFERADYLRRIAGGIKDNGERIARIISLESGKAIRFSRGEVRRAMETFKFAADEADKLTGGTVPMDAARTGRGRIGFYMRVPVGPVVAITPFNFPLNLPAHKIAPAIAAGDTVIWKPASATPLTAVLLAEIIEDSGVPPGVVNLVFGPGSLVGENLVRNENINLISFTGSLEVGKKIRDISGLKRTILELGSNSAMVVDVTAENIKDIIKRSMIGAYANAGQVCISIQRIYVHENIFEDFCSRFVEESRSVKIGNPIDEDVLYGPMITEKDAIRAEEWIEKAIGQGAKSLLRGERNNAILTPTVLTDVTFEMDVVSKEVFAPVVSIMPYRDFRQAIDMVNNSIYGLNAGIFTSDIKKAILAVNECEVGSVIINDYPTFRVDQMPYGGVKMSGMGREGPPFSINEYTDIRFVALR